jgi:macrolide transport system ATP-binding/permease protein
MLILEAGNIKKYYSHRLIIEFDELKVYSGDKIGIVGQNGSGKTTLMNILSNEIEPDEGFVRQYCDIAYIRQFSDEMIEADQKILSELNLSQKLNQKVFSGGERTRIKIANAFSNENLLLFADEPTANLDYKGIELLKQKLYEMDSFLLISHDRNLLDCLCNKILEVRDGKIKLYNGNYSSYKEQNELELRSAEQEFEKYISEKTKLEEAVRDRQRKSRSMKKAPRRMGNSEARLHTREANEKQEKVNNAVNSLKTRLQKLEVKEKTKELPQIKLDFSLTNPPENKIVISAEKLNFSYGKKKIFDNVNFNIYNGSKTALWGENGTGKTTLLNLINSKSSENIYIVPKARIGYFHQSFENLEDNKSVLENVMKDTLSLVVFG